MCCKAIEVMHLPFHAVPIVPVSGKEVQNAILNTFGKMRQGPVGNQTGHLVIVLLGV